MRRTLDRLPVNARVTAFLLLTVFTEAAVGGNVQALTLSDALERALSSNPRLSVSRAEINAAEARARQAEFGPALEVGLELENFGGSGDLSGTDALESTLQLSRALELGGKRARTVEVARAAHTSALDSLDVATLEIAGDTTRRFVEVLSAQEQLQTAYRFLDLAKAILDQAKRRVDAGLALSAELHRARAEAGREQLFVARSQADLDLARQALAATWGEPVATVPAVTGDLLSAPPIEPLSDFLGRVEQSPRLASLATIERLRATELRLAETELTPDLEFSLGVRHLAEPGDAGFVAGFSMPLGTRSRGRARTAEAEALLRQSQAQTAADRLVIVTAVTALHRQIELRSEALRILERDVLPATSSALEQIDRGYRLGRLGYGEYAQAAREALDAELERLRLAAEYHQLLTELEALTGTGLFGADRS